LDSHSSAHTPRWVWEAHGERWKDTGREKAIAGRKLRRALVQRSDPPASLNVTKLPAFNHGSNNKSQMY